MTTSESKGRFFYKTNRFESIGITNRIESIRIANWNALTSRPRRHCQCSDRRNSRGDLCDVEVNLATWWHLCMYKVRYLCISLQTCNVSSSSENAKIRLDGGPGNIQTSSFFIHQQTSEKNDFAPTVPVLSRHFFTLQSMKLGLTGISRLIASTISLTFKLLKQNECKAWLI